MTGVGVRQETSADKPLAAAGVASRIGAGNGMEAGKSRAVSFRLGGWAQAEWCHLSAAAVLARPPDKRAANKQPADSVESVMRAALCVGSDPGSPAVCTQCGARALGIRQTS